MIRVIEQSGSGKFDITDYWLDFQINGIYIVGRSASLRNSEDDICLGRYETKERAKQVFDEMVNVEKLGSKLINDLGMGKGYTILNPFYQMPKE